MTCKLCNRMPDEEHDASHRGDTTFECHPTGEAANAACTIHCTQAWPCARIAENIKRISSTFKTHIGIHRSLKPEGRDKQQEKEIAKTHGSTQVVSCRKQTSSCEEPGVVRAGPTLAATRNSQTQARAVTQPRLIRRRSRRIRAGKAGERGEGQRAAGPQVTHAQGRHWDVRMPHHPTRGLRNPECAA